MTEAAGWMKIDHGQHLAPRLDILDMSALGEAALFLQAEISSLLEKRALTSIPSEQRSKQVPEETCIQDVNTETAAVCIMLCLLHFLSPGDWFTTVDLKDAHFHISIYQPHRKYVGFASL